MRCPECMKMIPDGSNTCPECGKALETCKKEVYHLDNGTVLYGRYEVVSVIGFGGFGVVYKAWDTNLNRTVAIKEYFPTMYLNRDAGTVKAEVFDPKNEGMFLKEKEAFLREARQIAGFSKHSNIVHVYDFFEENNTAYFVMEYMDGRSLNEYIKEARIQGKVLTIDSAVHVVIEVLEALKSVHKVGIIHRDIKPHNIFILNNGTVKLFDFGAARFSDIDHEVTRTIIVSPGYAPAEQYQSKSKQGPYTDIYALGAVLYEMVTGVRPEESVNRKYEDSVVCPSELNTKVSDVLDSIIMRAMAVRTEIRFQSASDFEKALKNGKKVRDAKREEKRQLRKRNGMIAIIALIVLISIGYSGWRLYSDYRKVVLADASLEIWVPQIGDDEQRTISMYQTMSEEFLQNNPQMSINFTVIPSEQYVETLTGALAAQEGPDVFDSTLLGSDCYRYFADVELIYDDRNYGDSSCYYLEKDRSYFESIGKIPLLFDVPVLYMITGSEDLENSTDYQSFLNRETNYIGTVSDYDMVLEDMTGVFEIDEKPFEDMNVTYLNCWSINANSPVNEQEAGARLVNYFLSSSAQNTLSIDNNLGMPLSKEVWSEYIEINNSFSYLSDLIESYSVS